MLYEYESEQLPILDGIDEMSVLNKRGANGWMVCGIWAMEASLVFYFMRPYTKPVE